jgi:very-short-patch-repair endonuclease
MKARTIMPCEYCGKEISVIQAKMKKKKHHYCSVGCSSNALQKRITKACEICGREMFLNLTQAKTKKYCSFRCRNIAIARAKPITSVKVVCVVCGKEFLAYPCQIKKGRKFCSHHCLMACLNQGSRKPTSIEIAIEDVLTKTTIPHQKQVRINHVGIADFVLFEGLIVECDGDYWHSRPGKKNKDFNRDFVAFFQGFYTVRLPEHKIRKDPDRCINEALEKYIIFLEGHDPSEYDFSW